MAFNLYDTRQKRQVEFQPLEAGKVKIYNCGPTVYSTAHIGNFRSFVFADLLRRYFEYRGFEVTQVMNITDVGHLTEDDRADAGGEDKLQKTARELGWDPFKVARHFEDGFHSDRVALGIQNAHQYPRATDHIPDMLVQVQQLLDRGHAYIPEGTGEVYYDISSFPEYGKLSGKITEDLEAGARVEVNTVKRHPADFALWKTEQGHLMQWDPHADATWEGYPGARPKLDERIQKGFPGWHIECSAMSSRYLGDTFDIHTGGEDNIFPHHECEIAQAKGATDGEFSRYWMHARHLLVNNKKMSKSEGTLYTLEDLKAKGYTAKEIRYLLLSNHYRQPMNFTLEGLDAARASMGRLQTCRDLLVERKELSEEPKSAEVDEAVAKLERGFGESLDDDLNTANALAAVFEFVNGINRVQPTGADAAKALAALDRADHVLGVLNKESKSGTISKAELDAEVDQAPSPERAKELLAQPSLSPAELRQVALARHAARKNKDWGTADAIRDGLKALGVLFEDTPQGVRFKLP
ncbi:MAG: cysteine--tRNA ligase [Polyangiaceae bacterium]|nr:cysteine--tRNA ligase [Polyangiaceae bacterium]